jgi:hypothetical protein
MCRFDDGIVERTPREWMRKVDAIRTAELRAGLSPFDGESEQQNINRNVSVFEDVLTAPSPRHKEVRCLERPDLRFPSVHAAAHWLGMDDSQFVRWMRMDRDIRGFHFEYAS